MQKMCRICKNNFEIFQEDLDFLKKIGDLENPPVEIPAPTLCPECRQVQRMAFRNQRKLYSRKCDVTGANIISVFNPQSHHKVCEKNHWYSDKFDPLSYGRDFDFSKSFFEQFHSLLLDIPLPSLRVERCENCEFNTDMSDSKNCYLCSRTHKSEDMMYTYRGSSSKSCVDCYQVLDSELLYDCVECINCYGSRNLYFSTQCSNSGFLFDCHSCMDCMMCTNLRNKKYCFMNEQLTKEAYEEKVKGIDLGSEKVKQFALKHALDFWKSAIKKDITSLSSEHSSGDNLVNVKNCFQCFGIKRCVDCRYLWDIKEYKDSMDAYSGGRDSELIYQATSTTSAYNCKFCFRVTNSSNVMYSFFIDTSKNCFGCVGLRRAEYCILNKQYSKEEYEVLVPRIIEHMKKSFIVDRLSNFQDMDTKIGDKRQTINVPEWGEFFPASISLFGYNETVAQEYFPLTKEQALARGYTWSDYESPAPNAAQQFDADQLPDSISQATDDILNATICCQRSKKLFKITPKELEFYKKQNIPLPRLHPDERHMERFKRLNPLRLRKDVCARCKKQIETTYPVGTENVYCTECYQGVLV